MNASELTGGLVIATLISTAVEYQLIKRRFSSEPVFADSTLRQLSSRYVSIVLYIAFWMLFEIFAARADRCAGVLLGVAGGGIIHDLMITVSSHKETAKVQQKWFLVDILQDLILLVLAVVNLVLAL